MSATAGLWLGGHMASLPLVPHFDLPFRFDATGHAAVVDQDTLEDVSNCVQAVLRTTVGQRQEMPTFGITDPTLQTQPILQGDIIAAVLDQEPRAVLVIDQSPDSFDNLIDDILVDVSTKGVT